MDAGHAFDLAQLLDLLYRDLDTFFAPGSRSGRLFLLGDVPNRRFHALHKHIGHFHARHLVPHVASHARGLQRSDARQDVDPLVQAHLPHPAHVLSELVHVVDELSLNEVGPHRDLLGQAVRAEVEGVGEGIGRRADEEARLHRFDGIAA